MGDAGGGPAAAPSCGTVAPAWDLGLGDSQERGLALGRGRSPLPLTPAPTLSRLVALVPTGPAAPVCAKGGGRPRKSLFRPQNLGGRGVTQRRGGHGAGGGQRGSALRFGVGPSEKHS